MSYKVACILFGQALLKLFHYEIYTQWGHPKGGVMDIWVAA
jgi:hypothetical protein